jgi:hypothetical protein
VLSCLGERAWWLPRWLSFLPGRRLETPAGPAVAPQPEARAPTEDELTQV